MKNEETGEWFDLDGKYQYSLNNGYEVWLCTPVVYSATVEFCIKYQVNGQTYWDNNWGVLSILLFR